MIYCPKNIEPNYQVHILKVYVSDFIKISQKVLERNIENFDFFYSYILVWFHQMSECLCFHSVWHFQKLELSQDLHNVLVRKRKVVDIYKLLLKIYFLQNFFFFLFSSFQNFETTSNFWNENITKQLTRNFSTANLISRLWKKEMNEKKYHDLLCWSIWYFCQLINQKLEKSWEAMKEHSPRQTVKTKEMKRTPIL